MRRRIRRFALSTALFVAVFTIPGHASSQIRASEKAVVSQTLDGTTLTLEYYRPSAKGRTLFGGIVPWGGVWTPGANWATTLEVSKDVEIAGVEVPAGKYSVWAIPREDRFTVTLNENPEIFHFAKPDSSSEGQIHISVEPTDAPHMEMLTWSFPAVRGDLAILQFQWGTTALPMQVMVEPTRPIQLPDDERALYVGSYHMEMTPGLGWPESGTFEVIEEDGMLRGRMPFGIHPEDELTFDLIPAGEGLFNPRLYREGEEFGVEMGVNIDFALGMDVAESVRWYGPMGTTFATGDRIGPSDR
jgi:hypothetical protein